MTDPAHDPRAVLAPSDVPPATVDTVVRNATVVTVDPDDRVLPDGAVAVHDGHVVGVGSGHDVLARWAGREVVDARGGILLPTLVNAHTHLAMTLFRGIADDRDLQGFLDTVFPAEAATLSPDTVAAGVELAIAESLRAGCTTALDMYFWPDVALEVAARAGFRLVAGAVFVGFPGADGHDFDERLRLADDWLSDPSRPRWVMPHSTYTLDPDQLRAIAGLAEAHDARVHVHAAENRSEVDQVVARHARTPVQLLADVGLLPRATLAHAVVLDDADLQLVADAGAMVSHCPGSNLKLASGFARVVDLMAAGVVVGLGTDGVASSNDLDLFTTMRLAALAQKAVRGDATAMPATTVLRAATVGGAQACGVADQVGSIEVGKRADLVLLDADSASLSPAPDPRSAVVYAASRADVRRVWHEGRAVVVDGEPTTIDRAAAAARVRAIARR